MQTRTTTLPAASTRPVLTWTDDEIERLCWDANVLNKIIVHGLRKAAAEAFLTQGYRLATITNDIEPFETIHKLSMYLLGNRQHANPRELKKMVRQVMADIGCKLRADECMIQTSGRRLVVSVFLPRWAWMRLPPA